MKRVPSRCLLLALATACHLSAHAADPVPAHLAGAWGTAESLYAGTVAQYELLLLSDGFGSFTGSTPPMTHTGGPDKGKPAAARVIMGLPLRAVVDGDVLKAQPFIPRSILRPGDKAPAPEAMTITCRYEAQGQTLSCVGPDRRDIVMKRYSETVPAETAEMLRKIRAADDGGQG
ncbi:hypothetical protein [Massilia sp. LjRoot122]|uniref:hypothetical protein n=1 Tax=Massilia sp. LjRoot122 TaxID=3342257 RepID=UPI003ECED287